MIDCIVQQITFRSQQHPPSRSSPVVPLSSEVEDFVFDVGILLLQHLGRGLVDDLHLSEIPKKVSIEVHIEFTIVVEGQP